MSWAERLTMAKANVRHALLELRTRRWPPGVIESGEASP
jgi:hypothetical protein